MKLKQFYKLLLFIVLIPFLSSCFEVIEEITMKNDGTGDVLLTINLSQSKTKVASVMLLDSVQGYKVPSKQKIQQELNEAVAYLRKSEGISNVKSTSDFNNYIATISFSFKDVSNINNITKNILGQQKIKATNTSSYAYNKVTKTFSRKYQAIGSAKAEFNKLKAKDKAVFNGATYTSIYRFESVVTSSTNPASNVSKSKKAVMLKSSVMDLINGKINVSNSIQLSK
ncbi:hypothetical protein J7E50_06385 [Pedobacter sp. ISL-68]|uniref:hypothetical protein n=1 Tax=unclassified Pedobacter TaxID=2628915 RepID=UPI001BEBF5DB|nr:MULTISPECIES: hypothetical protein [unclassified Pedobacter]MBT2564512.1 hypothetical protein [Pedobacter sp. ISL-64]MBT2589838.1 hypothetical protein [Pedobacter sp. ISL-68]